MCLQSCGNARTVLRTGKILTLHPFEGRVSALKCTSKDFKDMTIFGALERTCEMDGHDGSFENNARPEFS